MSQIVFDILEKCVASLKLTPEAVVDELRLAAAVKLYELGRLSSGAAARLAGIPRVVFLTRLADDGVDTFQLSESELSKQR